MKMNGSIHSLGSLLFAILLSRTFIFCMFALLFLLNVHVESIAFNNTSFSTDTPNIKYGNDSAPSDGKTQLTKNVRDAKLTQSVGRASYSQPVRLWDKSSGKMTNFTTHFSFDITQVDEDIYGDGLAFFLAPFDSSTASAPENSGGGCLGLVGGNCTSGNVTSKYPFVAVEFDVFPNPWDPSSRSDHLGIDVTSVNSTKTFEVDNGLRSNKTAHAWITYTSLTKNLSVFLTYDAHFVFRGESNFSYIIDLCSILPEMVRVGFSAATGDCDELHNIVSWDFNSTLEETNISVPALPPNHTITTSPAVKNHNKSKAGLVGGLVAGISIFTTGVLFVWWRRRSGDGSEDINFDVDDDFDQATGPKRFTYNELSFATNNFHKEGKLGEGGFGGVYRGFLTELGRDIAVKKISKG